MGRPALPPKAHRTFGRSITTRNLYDYVDAIRSVTGPMCIAPMRSDAPLSFEGRCFVGDLVQAWNYSFASGHRAFSSYEHDAVSIVTSLEGQLTMAAGPSRHTVAQGECRLLQSPGARSMNVPGAARHMGLCISRPALNERLSRMLERPSKQDLVFQSQLDVQSDTGALLTHFAEMLSSAALAEMTRANPGVGERLETALLDVVLHGVRHNESEALATAPPQIGSRHIQRAVEFMRSRLNTVVGLEEIAAASGVGVRALQYGFQDALGMSPMAYLRRLRLEGAKRDLERDAISSLAEIAAKWRFSNPTRFVAYFLESYRVHPSSLRPPARQ